MLKQQRTIAPPALPDSPWAAKVYRRQVYLRRTKTHGVSTERSEDRWDEAPGVSHRASTRDHRSSRTAENEEETSFIQITQSMRLSPIVTDKYKDLYPNGANDDDELNPEVPTAESPSFRAGARSSVARASMRRSMNTSPEAQRQRTGDSEDEGTNFRSYEKRRSMYYTMEFSEDEEEDEDDSTDESESDGDDNMEQDEGRVEVFFQFQEHDEIAKADMWKALEALGFMCPHEAWIKDAWNSVAQFWGKVDLDDFLAIVQAYENRQHVECATAFASCDKNGSGVVESSELADLLMSLHMEPMSHVLDEVIKEVDTSGMGTLNLEEFKAIMQLIRVREGFSKSEYEEFISVFERFDRDNSGECDASELAAILNWLGFAWSRDRMKAVLQEVDVDQSGSVNKREFIVCMRKVRDVELEVVKQAMLAADRDGDGTISKDEMPDLLKGLGYDPWDVRVILEAQRRAGLEHELELDLGQVWQVLLVYRQSEGFSEAECENLGLVFEQHAKDDELGCVETNRALRSLGYKFTFEVVQSVIGKVDVDDTGTISIYEFRKMMRMIQEREANLFRHAFRDCPVAQCSRAAAIDMAQKMGLQLRRHHFVLEGEEEGEAAEEDAENITEDIFTRACCNLAKEMREVFMQNGGFSNEEVKEFQVMFDSYDSRKLGKIENKDLVLLVENVCPSLAREKALRPQLQEMMQACRECNKSLGFKDFLKLMRLVLDFQDKERAQREATTIKTTGFSSSEVQEFRDLFLESDEGFGVVSFEACRAMIHAITPLGDNLTHQLQGIFRGLTRQKVQHGRGSADEVDFPEFLQLMKQLLDTNFAKLKEKTSLR